MVVKRRTSLRQKLSACQNLMLCDDSDSRGVSHVSLTRQRNTSSKMKIARGEVAHSRLAIRRTSQENLKQPMWMPNPPASRSVPEVTLPLALIEITTAASRLGIA